MDAVEFLKELKRRSERADGTYFRSILIRAIDPVSLVDEVEQWAKDHPIKTRQSEFLKMFPNANRDEDGTLHACPEIFEPGIKKECDGDCHRCKCKRDYWFQEVE